MNLFSLLTKSHQKLFAGLLVATKSAEPNAVLMLLSTADTESHGCASGSWLGRAILNLVIPSLRVQGTLAT
ncbi:hypothetical protein OAG22_00145, partial [Candidatus Poseidoniaceae archaeon]|nr:hypothetical protein [Candidatus Poseidoniaceae archaeon]